MSDGLLLFLMGKQRAGKDTTADYLINYYGFTKARLAQPVYQIGQETFGMCGKDRGLLIQIGVKMREIDAEVFPKALWRKVAGDIDTPLPDDARIVVTDVRFQNEWDFFKARGGFALRIVASQQVRSQRPGYNPEFEYDTTETRLDDAPADAEIVNEGTYGQLYDAIDRFAQEMLHLERLS
ncbi:MAG TPA: hypothetical protein GXZ82_08325 [Firmicutes bacterium]|nr:hypothetical protein [Bacillota bacterium]